jgi:hypothetical protein
MPNEDGSNSPPADPQAQSISQSPVAPSAPQQDEVRKDPDRDTANEESETAKFERDIKNGEIWLIAINALLLITNIVIASIYFGQLQEMRKATVASERAANAAKSAADTADATLKSSKESFIIEQRPYIVVDENSPFFLEHPPTAGQQILANVYLKNIGRTPAVQVVTRMGFFSFHGKLVAKLTANERNKATEEYIALMESKFAELKKTDDIARKRIRELEPRNIAPGQDVAPTKTYFLTSPDTVVSKEDFPLLATGEVTLFAIGLVSYSDAYKVTYKTEFCYSWFGPDPKIWHICDSHNRYQ